MQMSHAFHTIPSTISLHFLLQKDVRIALQLRLKISRYTEFGSFCKFFSHQVAGHSVYLLGKVSQGF